MSWRRVAGEPDRVGSIVALAPRRRRDDLSQRPVLLVGHTDGQLPKPAFHHLVQQVAQLFDGSECHGDHLLRKGERHVGVAHVKMELELAAPGRHRRRDHLAVAA